MKVFSLRTLKVLTLMLLASTVGLAILLGMAWRQIQELTPEVEGPRKLPAVREEHSPVSPLLLTYQLDLPGRGEIFPALAGSSAAEYWPVAVLSVINMSEEPAILTISSEVRGWSRTSVERLIVAPRETRKLGLNPELLPEVYNSHEVRRASLDVNVTSWAGETLFSDSRQVLLHAGTDLYWGKQFANAQFIARWIT